MEVYSIIARDLRVIYGTGNAMQASMCRRTAIVNATFIFNVCRAFQITRFWMFVCHSFIYIYIYIYICSGVVTIAHLTCRCHSKREAFHWLLVQVVGSWCVVLGGIGALLVREICLTFESWEIECLKCDGPCKLCTACCLSNCFPALFRFTHHDHFMIFIYTYTSIKQVPLNIVNKWFVSARTVDFLSTYVYHLSLSLFIDVYMYTYIELFWGQVDSSFLWKYCYLSSIFKMMQHTHLFSFLNQCYFWWVEALAQTWPTVYDIVRLRIECL